MENQIFYPAGRIQANHAHAGVRGSKGCQQPSPRIGIRSRDNAHDASTILILISGRREKKLARTLGIKERDQLSHTPIVSRDQWGHLAQARSS